VLCGRKKAKSGCHDVPLPGVLTPRFGLAPYPPLPWQDWRPEAKVEGACHGKDG